MRIALIPGMLKITAQREAGVLRVELEGRLAGPWVKELEHCWRSTAGPQPSDPVRVDLTSVTFIDTAGKELLKAMHRDGVELVATGCLNRCIVETIERSDREEEA